MVLYSYVTIVPYLKFLFNVAQTEFCTHGACMQANCHASKDKTYCTIKNYLANAGIKEWYYDITVYFVESAVINMGCMCFMV